MCAVFNVIIISLWARRAGLGAVFVGLLTKSGGAAAKSEDFSCVSHFFFIILHTLSFCGSLVQ